MTKMQRGGTAEDGTSPGQSSGGSILSKTPLFSPVLQTVIAASLYGNPRKKRL